MPLVQLSTQSPCLHLDHLDGGQAISDLLNDLHLLHQELLLDEVNKVEVLLLCCHSLQVLQGADHHLLHLQHCSHGLQGSAPLHPGGLGDVLQHHLASTLGLVFHQGIPMVPNCNGRLLEEACKARKCLVNLAEVVSKAM